MNNIEIGVDNIDEVRVKITDVTLREGDQAPLTSFIKEEKAIIALMLEQTGVDTIEAGFAASPAEKENKNILMTVDVLGDNSITIVSSLGMSLDSNTDDSWDVLKNYKNPRIHIFIATPNSHINEKFTHFGKDINERRNKVLNSIVKQIEKAIFLKTKYNNKLEIEVSAEAASDNAIDSLKRLDFESDEFKFLIKWVRTVIIAGASIINIPDTLGNLLPWEMEKLFLKLGEETNDLKGDYYFEFSCHVHNDSASATTGALGAIRGGARQIELTVEGIGERAGNTPLHEIVGIITSKPYSIIDGKKITIPNIKTELVGPVSNFVSRILNLNRTFQRPFIGELSDKDGSGVHNAAKSLYGGSKDKLKYGGRDIEEFFCPRGGRNQVNDMLKKYGVNEDPKSDIITKVTNKACKIAETTKALYGVNLFVIYLQEKGDFELSYKNINISGYGVTINFKLFGKYYQIEYIPAADTEQGFVNGCIQGINRFLGTSDIDIIDIDIISKPSLRQAVEEFYQNVSQTTFNLSSEFKQKVSNIIGNKNEGDYSKQTGVSHAYMKVNGSRYNSVASGHDITKNNILALMFGALPKIIEKVSGKMIESIE